VIEEVHVGGGQLVSSEASSSRIKAQPR
jgi:hypothetical protein